MGSAKYPPCMAATGDPYKILGLGPEASDQQIRAAYHRLVQANHPDHNEGSPDSARRFEEIQEAYSRIRELRASRPAPAPPPAASEASDPAVEARLADMERKVRDAHAARERARRAAAEAAAANDKRPSDEELGYVHTDDSFGKILADAEAELTQRLSGAKDHPAGGRVANLLEELAARLRGKEH
jgi:molecular chaperone DnaJ